MPNNRRFANETLSLMGDDGKWYQCRLRHPGEAVEATDFEIDRRGKAAPRRVGNPPSAQVSHEDYSRSRFFQVLKPLPECDG